MASKKNINKVEVKGVTPKVEDNNVENPDLELLKKIEAARKNKSFGVAKEMLQKLLNAKPSWLPARYELISLYFDTESYQDAKTFLLAEIKTRPDDFRCLISLARVYATLGDQYGELDCLKKIHALNKSEQILRRLFDLLRDTGDLAGALDVVLELRNLKDTPELHLAHAKLLSLLDRSDESLVVCEEILSQEKLSPAAVDLFVTINLQNKNSPQLVLDKFIPLLEKNPNEPSILQAIGRTYHRMDKNEEALTYHNKALSLEPKNAIWWYDLSLIQRQLGMLEESQDALEKSLNLNALNPISLRVHGVEHKYTLGDTAFNRLHYAHACENQFNEEQKVELYFSLAKAFEDIDELATAFKYYENAGVIQTKLTPYNHAGALSVLKMTRNGVGPATYENFKLPRSESDKPVFILGMPRSGTSLTEQVLSSHPDVHGAGELKILHRVLDNVSINGQPIQTRSNQQKGMGQAYIPGIDLSDCRALNFMERGELYVKSIEALAASAGHSEAKRIIDKMPGNYFWTGVIPFILPNAKIIHTQRHPLDNCLSIYRIFFPDGMPWSYDLRNLGKTYRAYYEHMAYWENNLPKDFMLTVNYEVMIADFDNKAKQIVSHVGLNWDDKCLKFYENDRAVKTASLTQVRKPIYNSSVGRWKKYEDYLKPLIKELGPVLKHYDDKIEKMISEVKK